MTLQVKQSWPSVRQTVQSHCMLNVGGVASVRHVEETCFVEMALGLQLASHANMEQKNNVMIARTLQQRVGCESAQLDTAANREASRAYIQDLFPSLPIW